MVDLTSLNTFKNVNLGNENAIVNLNQDNKLTSNTTFSKANIFRFLRSSSTQANNNHVRTELLKSLGKAFGLEQGIGTGPKGEVTFSKDFMDKLEKLIGPSFKREDFGVPAEGGAVKSGKPLTQRRINQIMTQAATYETKDFSIATYKDKLNVILKDLGIPDTTKMSYKEFKSYFEMHPNPTGQAFAEIQRCLDFLENDLDGIFRNEPGYDFDLECIPKENKAEREALVENTDVKFQIKNQATGNYEALNGAKLTEFTKDILWPRLGGNLIHTERAKFSLKTSESITPLKNYIASIIKGYAKNGIDCYLEAKAQGKEELLKNHCEHHLGACMEDKGKNFFEFRQKHLDKTTVDVNLEADLEAVLDRDNATTFKKMIETEVFRLSKQNPEGEWKDFAPEVKDMLRGKSGVVTVLNKHNENGVTIREYTELKENGKNVIRPLTDDEIDIIGQEICNEIDGVNDPDEEE